MEAAYTLFDRIVGAFVTAINTGGVSLSKYGLALLGVLFVISYAREFGPQLATGVGSMSEALGTPLLFFLMIGGYMYVLANLIPMTTAALNTAVNWGFEMGGSTKTVDAIKSPSFIIKTGLEVAKPIGLFDTRWNALVSTVKMVVTPSNLIIFWLILLAFLASAIHFGMTIIEFSLSVALTYVLLPWAIWRPAASLGEFAVGWVIGCLVRALVSCAIIGIAIPLFPLILTPLQTFIDIGNVVARVSGTLLFATIALAVPGRVANWASRAGLALTGSTVGAGAMTFARFGMAGNSVVRGFSHLIGR